MLGPPGMKIVLPIYPLSLNRLLRLHWRTRGRKRDAWEGAIASRVGFGPWYAGRREVRAPRRARVSILVGREKLQDPDNCVGSVKVVLDALCRTGWIYDD